MAVPLARSARQGAVAPLPWAVPTPLSRGRFAVAGRDQGGEEGR
jgi:hypothetical protein